MRGEAVRTEGRALSPLSREDILGLVEEVLESHGIDLNDVKITYTENQDVQPETGDLVIYPARAPSTLRQKVTSVGATLWDEEDIIRHVGIAALVMLGAEYELTLEPTDTDTYTTTPVKVDSVEAKDIARPYVSDATVALLEMIPHRIYTYTCNTTVRDGPVKETFQEQGQIALNLVNGELSTLEFNSQEQTPKDRMGDTLEPQYTEDEAHRRAKKLLLKEISRDINLEREENETQIYEKRTITPPDDTLKLKDGTLIYKGIWTVKGGRKDVVIDATSGDVISPELGDAELI